MGITVIYKNVCDKCKRESVQKFEMLASTMALPQPQTWNMVGKRYFCVQCFDELNRIIDDGINAMDA